MAGEGGGGAKERISPYNQIIMAPAIGVIDGYVRFSKQNFNFASVGDKSQKYEVSPKNSNELNFSNLKL